MSILKIIVAIAEDRVIGNKGQIPWHISDDLKLFKKNTLGHTVIMGRKTFDSIGKPLSGRRNIIISNTLLPFVGAEVYSTLLQALKVCAEDAIVFIIGGARLYAEALPLADELLISRVKGSYPGDTFFPVYDEDQWQCVETIDFQEFTFCRYRYKQGKKDEL